MSAIRTPSSVICLLINTLDYSIQFNMIINKLLKNYDLSNLTIAVIGSHSALDVCRGAKDLGFNTLVIAQPGRELTYHTYYRTEGARGCVDKCIIVNKFDDILNPVLQDELISENVIFIPHRSFEAYLHFDYKAIENKFKVPMFGNKYILKIEERGNRPNQYDLLDEANIHYPRQFKDPKKIDRLCLVKVLEKERGFERAFFLAENYQEYKEKIKEKLDQGLFTEKQLEQAVIEEFVIGVQVNFNFFYSPFNNSLELLGTDTRRQTNIEGFLKIPASYQEETLDKISLKYEEAGHIAVTILESMLEPAFAMAERFVKACEKMYSPGIIGPFALQSIIIPGPPKKDIIVIDVSPRVPGSPGIFATPYSGYLYGQPLSVGKRIAMEIKQAADTGNIDQIVT